MKEFFKKCSAVKYQGIWENIKMPQENIEGFQKYHKISLTKVKTFHKKISSILKIFDDFLHFSKKHIPAADKAYLFHSRTIMRRWEVHNEI